MLNAYVKEILEVARQGDATEESYYSTLKDFLMEFAIATSKKDIHITILPKKTEAGNPDFRIWDGKQKIIGYIEAKPPETNLDQIEKTEQIIRYKSTFQNLMITNFFEFRLYKDGTLIDRARIADPMAIYTLKGIPSIENAADFKSLLDKFLSFSFPSISSAETLAVELAKRTRFLRDEVIATEIKEEEKNGVGKILGFYEAFQTYLIRGLTKEQFADLYSQTITYGLFASRMRCEGEFNRKLAVDDIPHTIGILREIFDFISLGDLPTQLEWIVDEISTVLANVDVKKIFSEYYRNKKGEDPVFHFYETFLAKYDPEEREKRGVYYTPKPVVSYIARSLHTILKEEFGLENGLANENVTILDPAAGTLTFLAEAIKGATDVIVSKFGEGIRRDFIKEHVLRNFYAFELMVAPYAIGHLKISFLLDELGYSLQKNERVKFYLTNTLELEEIEQTALPGMASLAEESRNAGAVKKKIPILVILANPPYSGTPANTGKWITNLVGDYKFVDGKPLDEKNPKWLLDDYVKFIRFAEWKINQIGKGVIGYITNHSYLDNPTFRGMRQHLMKSFDEVYVLNLHGNTLKKERCPDRSKDENVFDIRQGVAIAFFINTTKNGSIKGCRVFHSERWGLREEKYDWLKAHDIKTTDWQEIQPKSPFYLFVPREEKYEQLYNKFWKITDVFSENSVGIVTARDRLTIQYTPNEVWKVVQDFTSLSEEHARTKYNLGKDVRDWRVSFAQDDLETTGLRKEHIVSILYRPFDIRYTYYTGHSRGFICMPRPGIMQHMMRENLALLVHKRKELDVPYSHFFVTDTLSEHGCLSSKTTNYHFPLYLYVNSEKRSNVNRQLIKVINKTYDAKLKLEAILGYVYGIFYSNIYRTKYVDFLKLDFPRVPFTTNYDLFIRMGTLGKKLIDLHLLESKELKNPIAKFQGVGNNIVDKTVFKEEESRVFINKTQYFEGIDEEIWNYHIGGYQVLSKWLKYRKGVELSLDDIKHFCKVATAIQKTIEIQEEIDKLYPDVEKDIIPFKEEDTTIEKYTK